MEEAQQLPEDVIAPGDELLVGDEDVDGVGRLLLLGDEGEARDLPVSAWTPSEYMAAWKS